MIGTVIYRLIGLVVSTFVIAFLYGFLLTTMDFIEPNYNPTASGHKAADNVYGLFGTVTTEIKKNDDGHISAQSTSVAHKIARPYAVTADLSAILGGKMEVGLSSMIHAAAGRGAAHG